jgi:dTDP-4-amino-4,6-dideoxygalactose transaminase
VKKIDFLNYRDINYKYKKEYINIFSNFLDSGWYVLGNNVKKFEKEYAVFSETKYCVGVASGLDALILCLKALDIGQGDEVIVPSNTYIASWLAITQVGAKPIPVEPKIDSYNLNPVLIENVITKNTKAVMVVNLYGQSAELSEIDKICKSKHIFLIEDNAQAQGAKYKGISTGSFGIINATSFYPGKNLGALGDAGAITTNNKDLYEKVKTLRNYGSKIKYINEIKGINSRLDELQAGFLSLKLLDLKKQNNYRKLCSKKYFEILNSESQIILPIIDKYCSSVYHIYLIRTKKRDELQKYLNLFSIQTMIHYPVPPHLQSAYNDLGYVKGDFSIAEEIANTALSLPMGGHLSLSDIEFVGKKIIDFFNKDTK